MAQRSVSKSKFLDNVKGQTVPKPAAMADPVEGGPAVDDHKARHAALRKGPFLNATPKHSSGPRSTVPTFTTLSETERKAP